MLIRKWFFLLLGVFGSLQLGWAAPQIQTAPATLSGTTSLAGTVQVPLTLSNPGDAALNYSFPGADYAWKDSNFQGGPVYSWTDISSTGTLISGLGDETSAGPISIGFTFPFYGQNFSSFQLSSNGFLSFSEAIPSSSWTNPALPANAAAVPANLLAFFWDDLDFSAGGTAHYRLIDANTFVLQFKDVAFWNNTQNKVSCQAILKSDGTIILQYQRVDLRTGCTVGVQNAAKDRALQVVCNAALLHPGMALRITQHNGAPWMVISSAARSGSVSPGGSQQVLIPLDAVGLAPGTYQANLALNSNAGPAIQIPVTFTVQLLYSQWKANFFTDVELATPEISDDASDPDGDGLSNAMEFVLNSDPFVPGRESLPAPARYQNGGQSYLTLSFVHPKTAPEHTWLPEVSGDLSNWVSGALQTEVLSVTERGDGSELVTVRDLTPLSTVNRRFMRLKLMVQEGEVAGSLAGILAPIAPFGLSATVISGSQIDLRWQDFSSTETGFRIERKTTGGAYSEVATVGSGVAFFQNAGLVGNTAYSYRVCAVNAGGLSLYTNEAGGTTLPTPPSAPYAYTPTVASSSQINLSWHNYTSGVTGFRIERRRFDSTVFSLVIDTTSTATTYQDTGLQPSTQYFYQIASRNSAGLSGFSNVVSGSTQGPPPAAPTELNAAAASSYQINLSWVDNASNETGFRIERAMSATGPFTTVTTLGPGAVAHNDAILAGGVTYFYRVRAINGGGASEFTEANATTLAPVTTKASPFTVQRALGAYQANETINIVPLWQPDGMVKIRDTVTTVVPTGYSKIYLINEAPFVGELESYGPIPPYMNLNITKVIARGTEFWRFVNGPNGNDYIRPEMGGAADIFTGRAP